MLVIKKSQLKMREETRFEVKSDDDDVTFFIIERQYGTGIAMYPDREQAEEACLLLNFGWETGIEDTVQTLRTVPPEEICVPEVHEEILRVNERKFDAGLCDE